MNASMTRGFFPLSPPRVFFLRFMTFLLLVVFLLGSSNQSSSPIWDVFSLEVVVDGVAALSPVQSHLLCCSSRETQYFFCCFHSKNKPAEQSWKITWKSGTVCSQCVGKTRNLII